MLDTSARLLCLLALLQARPEWGGPELAGRLAVTTRTLRRDVTRLRDLGYQVHAVPGVAGGYRLGRGSTLPPLLLDDEEALAVVISLRAAAGHTVSGVAEASLRALAKLDQLLPARLRERTAALSQATLALPAPAGQVDPELLTLLAGACRSSQRLRFGYTDHGGAVTRRQAEPYRLVQAGYRWYLMARDLARDDWRSFRVDRISGAELAGGRFVPRDMPDPARFVGLAVTTAPYPVAVRAIVHEPVAAVAAKVPPTVAVLEATPDGHCLLTAGAQTTESAAAHLAALGAEFTVLEPPELVTYVRELAGRLVRAVGGPPAGAPATRMPGARQAAR